ncbi:MAG: SRPBCC family protein [Candidatus Dormibacteraeota bacterium]|nr:SRPBCC family protein [Candidatus Dormibacteraeota bacterium]
MYEFEHSLETAASPAAIYRLYSDVTAWPRWDAGVTQVELDGPFAPGATGMLTPAGQEALPFRMLEVVENEGFVDETEIPGTANLRFEHRLEPLAGGGTRITHRVVVTGPAAEQMGPMVTADVPEAMASLAKHALAPERASG